MIPKAVLKLRRGIGEKADAPNNMLSFLTRQLDAGTFELIPGEGDWRAEFGPFPVVRGKAYNTGRAAAAKSLADEIRLHPRNRPLIVAGYSGGAHVVGDALHSLSWVDRSKVTRAILVSDPAMPASVRPDQLIGGRRPSSWGITGGRQIWSPLGSDMITWVAHPNDAICCCPSLSPLRGLADKLTSLSLDDLGGWGLDYQRRLITGALQPTDPSPIGLRQAVVDLDGYLRRNEHGRHYPPLLEDIGELLNEEFGR